jgi:hypothetical protein
MQMPGKMIGKVALVVGLAVGLFSLFCLLISGQGDHPSSYQAYIIASAILVAGGTVALAVADRRE